MYQRATLLLPCLKQSCNSKQSQKFGRHIFQFELSGQPFWLKVQKNGHSEDHELSFLNEISNYQYIAERKPEILAPFTLLNTQADCGLDSSYLRNCLLVQHTDALFSIDPNSIDHSEVIKIMIKSLEALEKLHEIEVIHGDLKMEHFRVFENRCVLIDFEQCQYMTKLTNHIKNTATPRYMAPELFHAQSKSYATDVYSLGIIWLEWLSQTKLQAKSYYDWAILHCQNLKIELPVAFIPFNALVESMLMKKKDERCINFYQLKQQLSEAV